MSGHAAVAGAVSEATILVLLVVVTAPAEQRVHQLVLTHHPLHICMHVRA